MILSDLIAACERGFASVSIDTKREGIEISSGGNDVPGDANLRTEPAALYATEDLAVAAWLASFNASLDLRGVDERGMRVIANSRHDLRSQNTLIWVEKPYVESYRITLGDAAGTYRVVRNRYVVRGTVAVEAFAAEELVEETPLPAEVVAKPKRKTKVA
jgi:hypothetical protein